MRNFTLILFSILACAMLQRPSLGQLPQREALLHAAQKYPFRTWTDHTGTFQTLAKYLRHDPGSVTIMKQNHLVLVLPVSRLSAADQGYISSLSVQTAPASASPQPTETAPSPAVSDPPTPAVSETPTPAVSETPTPPVSETPTPPVSETPPSPRTAKEEVPIVEMKTVQQLQIANEGILKPLAQKDFRTVVENLDELFQGWPKQPLPDLVWAVAESAETGAFSVDEKALTLILKTGPHPHIAIFERTVNRPEFNLRSLGYRGLAAIKNDRALSVLLRKYDSDDDVFIGKLLIEFGSRSETRLLPHLEHKKPEHIMVTCSILGEIGTEKSLVALNELIQKTDKAAVRQQATTAINQIQTRQAANSGE